MKNIIAAVSGLTPQIVTETLYCLAVKKKIQIDEIYIITTERGKDVIRGKDKEYNYKRKYPDLISQIEKLCSQYKIKKPAFANSSKHIITADEQSTEMYDIRNDVHNKLFPNKVCEVLKKLTSSNDSTLHCSISGGRKTMSADMAFALSIFGREQDKLYHVLVDEKLEFSKFYPINRQEDKLLEIAEIPYIHLRSLLASSTKNKLFNKMSYMDLVKHLQNEIKILNSDKLTINIRRSEIFYGENEMKKIPPKQARLYQYIVSNSAPGSSISIEDLESHFYNKNSGNNIPNILSLISKIKTTIQKTVLDETYSNLFIIKKRGNTESKDNKKRFAMYGVEASRDKIQIIDN